MKILLLTISLTTLLFARYNINALIDNGDTLRIVCKEGVFLSVLTGTATTGKKYHIEKAYCINSSSWDGECKHEPIKCVKPKETK